MNNSTTEAKLASRLHAQKLVIYHPTSSGTGAALQLEPRVNRKGDDRYNCFFLEMATQKSAASRVEGKTVPASFDWEHKLTVKLDFTDICEMLAVLEGRVDKVGGQRSGLFHQNGATSTVISLQKSEKGGYFVGLSKKDGGSGIVSRVNITLSEAEAIGLRSIFQAGLFFITFHTHIFQTAA
ncbi:MAG: hypothetical protein WCL44_02880 [bacterium]